MSKKMVGFLVLLLLLVVVAVIVLGGDKTNDKRPAAVYSSQLTGMKVAEDVSRRPVLGVMIENSEEARPQSGLDSAGIVFEAVTEGGITRYLALFQEDMPDKVGPVRSLRPGFLDWGMGFDVSFAHVGGSPEALQLVDDREAKSLNEFKYSKPYFRDNSREAPHNLYARLSDLRALQAELGHESSDFKPFLRSGDRASQKPQAPNLTIDYSQPPYQVEFRYDQATNSYTRYLAGEPHIDSITNKPISVKNVIVIKLTDGTLGSGEALVFKNGNVLEAQWQQSSHEERLVIEDEDGREVALNRGDSWFAMLPESGSANY